MFVPVFGSLACTIKLALGGRNNGLTFVQFTIYKWNVPLIETTTIVKEITDHQRLNLLVSGDDDCVVERFCSVD
jgi:hypothetical protein